MKKSAKIILVCVSAFLVFAFIFAAVAIKNVRNKAYVFSIEENYGSMDWLSGGVKCYGIISDAGVQTEYIDEGKTVSRVFVKSGDLVKPGDSLFSYDTTELELSAEIEKSNVESCELLLASAKQLLTQYESIIVSNNTPEGNDENDEVSYTEEEKQNLISDQKAAIKKAELSLKSAKNSYESAKYKLISSVVKAKASGIVKNIGEAGAKSGEFCTVVSSGGLIIKANVNEFDYEKVKPGDKIDAHSYMSDATTTGTVVSVSDSPTKENYGGSGNPNSSYYEFIAEIENTDGFSVGDDVEITVNPTETDEIIIEKLYMRTDSLGAYCMIEDENGRLKRQEVTYTNTEDSDYIIILSGLKKQDYIAFPYGSSAKEGNKTTRNMMFSIF